MISIVKTVTKNIIYLKIYQYKNGFAPANRPIGLSLNIFMYKNNSHIQKNERNLLNYNTEMLVLPKADADI